MDEDEEVEVKNKAHSVIKMTNQRAFKLIRQAEATVDKIGFYVKDCNVLAYWWSKGCDWRGRWAYTLWGEL